MTTRDKIQNLIDKNMDAQDVLDELVHECAAEMASAANNDGIQSQLEFVERRGWTEEEVLSHILEELERITAEER